MCNVVFATCLLMLAGCGGETHGVTPSTSKEIKASSSPPMRSSWQPVSTAGSSAAVDPVVECGTVKCQAPSAAAALISMPCCLDPAAGSCGVSSLTGGGCMKPAVSDSRCPELDVMGFKLASCCTSSERCGLDTGMLGMPGCVDLESASAQVPAMGLITFPAPRACSDADAADAGS